MAAYHLEETYDLEKFSNNFKNVYNNNTDDNETSSEGDSDSMMISSEYKEYDKIQNNKKRRETFNKSFITTATNNNNIRKTRRPTRRPDPNTFNRNALMARENRRKKKEYIENLEKEVNYYKSMNKKFKKILNKQTKFVEKLKAETQYYKGVIANKNQIIPLIEAIKDANLSLKIGKNCTSQARQQFGFFENGTDTDPFWCTTATNYISTDFARMQMRINDWDDQFSLGSPPLLSDDGFISGNTSLSENNIVNAQVNDEHNYSNSQESNDYMESVVGAGGLCLHVSSGEISLKFCPACHTNKSFFGLED